MVVKTDKTANNNSIKPFRGLPMTVTTIKIGAGVWTSLNNLKKPNESFNDVILGLLGERSKPVGNELIGGIKFYRKTAFVKLDNSSGVEYEYNDCKGEISSFVLDVRIKKVFYGKQVFNPSVFFGVDHEHKHFNSMYLGLYFGCIAHTLGKEFKVNINSLINPNFLDIVNWRKLYFDYSLSEDSFVRDIEQPLKDSVEEKISDEVRKSIKDSVSNSILGLIK